MDYMGFDDMGGIADNLVNKCDCFFLDEKRMLRYDYEILFDVYSLMASMMAMPVVATNRLLMVEPRIRHSYVHTYSQSMPWLLFVSLQTYLTSAIIAFRSLTVCTALSY